MTLTTILNTIKAYFKKLADYQSEIIKSNGGCHKREEFKNELYKDKK
jgi:hypothetical protein